MISDKLGIKSESKTSKIKLISPSDLEIERYFDELKLPKVLLKNVFERRGTLDEERYLTSLYILLSLIVRGR
jgi:glycerol-3-phosphate dehydrogenase